MFAGFRELKRDTAISLSRWLVVNSVLGFSRCSMLRWLADVGGSGRSQKEPYPAAARTKSIKLLGGVIEVDVSVLSLSDVQVRSQLTYMCVLATTSHGGKR